MPRETPNLFTEARETVFAKTPKGRAEVSCRAAGLSGKQRSILIMLDGQKRLDSIGTLLPNQEVAAIVDMLLKCELIEARGTTLAPTVRSASMPVDPNKLLSIKSMMKGSAETYLGLMAAEVVRRVEQACNEPELLSVLGHWHMAMRESKYGREVAGMHLEQIKASFRAEE